MRFIPSCVAGSIIDIRNLDANKLSWWPWLSKVNNLEIYFHLGRNWPEQPFSDSPPPGYKYYVIQGDSNCVGWDTHLGDLYPESTIIVLTGPEVYTKTIKNIVYLPYTLIHQQIARLASFYPHYTSNKKIRFKASCLTNRLTQSKAIIHAALSYYLGNDLDASLSNKRHNLKNIHNWQPTSDIILDKFLTLYKDNWLTESRTLCQDDLDPHSPYNSAYTQSALNFTLESFHYSLMYINGEQRIMPGPFLTEKTFKCLLSETAFIPVGQYNTYHWLETIGFKFAYGDLDLSFDKDPGNLTRLKSTISLIESLQGWSAADLYDMTRDSSQFNRRVAISNDFREFGEQFNQTAINYILNLP